VFLGYPSNHRGYNCFELSSHNIIIFRHVFDENVFPLSTSHSESSCYVFFFFLIQAMNLFHTHNFILITFLLLPQRPHLNQRQPLKSLAAARLHLNQNHLHHNKHQLSTKSTIISSNDHPRTRWHI